MQQTLRTIDQHLMAGSLGVGECNVNNILVGRECLSQVAQQVLRGKCGKANYIWENCSCNE